MGVDPAIDITAAERSTVLTLLERHLPGTTAWVYGFRAKWTSTPQSDLHLVVFSAPEQRRQVGDLREAFDESNLPFRVDLFVWDEVSDSFRRRIEVEHVAFARTRHRQHDDRWKEVPLGKLVDIFDGPHATPRKTPTGPVFLGISNLASGRLDLEQREHLSEDDYVRWTRRVKPRPNDIVFSYETRLGEAALIPNGLRACLGRRMGLLRPKAGSIDPRFLLYAFLGEEFQNTIGSRTVHGSTVDRIPLTEMAEFPIYVPQEISEQRAIAHILGTLDDKIELNRRMNATLEAMVRALFKSWFVDFDVIRAKMEGRDTGLPKRITELLPDRMVESELGQIPDGWPLTLLSDLIELNPSRRLQKGQAAPYLNMANMPTRGHAPESVVERPFGSGMRFANGDTLMARITPCLENGKTAFVDFLRDHEIGWGSTEYIVMCPYPPLPKEFAYCLARSEGFREFAIQSMSGTSGRQRVPVVALSGYMIPRAGDGVAAEFGRIVHSLLERASRAVSECRKLAGIRDALLPMLLSGGTRVRDAKESHQAWHKE